QVVVVQVEPLGVGVELEDGAGRGGGGDYRVDIYVEGGSLAEAAAGRVEEDVGVGIVHGPDDPARLLRAGRREVRVHGDADDVEIGKGGVVDVEGAVAVDVHLGAAEHANAA